MSASEFDTGIYEAETLRGNINCGSIQLNLDRLTFSLTCIYCDFENMQWSNIKEFAYHFQEHLVMSETENQILLKNVEENYQQNNVDSFNDDVIDLKPNSSTTIENEETEQSEKQLDYEIEMLEDANEETTTEQCSNNDNTDEKYAYQVMSDYIDDSQVNDIQKINKIEPQQSDDDGTVDLGFDMVPNDTSPTTKNKKETFTCDVCNFKFADATTLRKHRQHHHHCHLCKVNFPSRAQLKNHLQTHSTNQKLFVCEECDNCFRSLSELTIHRKRHISDPLHLCNTCGKSFQQERALRDHIKTHTTARPFICMECNMTFSRQKALILHASMHSDVRKFSCTICRMSFAQNSGLITHMKEKHRNTFEDDEG